MDVPPPAGLPLPAAVGQSVALPAENSYLNPSLSVARLYLLNVSSPGTYTVALYGNQGSSAGLMHLFLDGQRVLGSLSLPYWVNAAAYSSPLLIDVGGDELGATLSDKLTEKEVTLSLARRLRNELQARGIPTMMVRDNDATIPIDDRAAAANAARPRGTLPWFPLGRRAVRPL